LDDEEFKAELKRIAKKVTDFILSTLKGEPQALYNAGLHLVKSGGKRLRPFIVIKSYNLYKEGEEEILPASAALELVHNFTLIHDDIMDRDDFRHGVPTVHRAYGDAMAILAGDMLFAEAFKLLTETPALDNYKLKLAVATLSKASVELCEGQSEDVSSISRDFNENSYYMLINKKTSSLLAASSSIGCIAGGGDEDDLKNAELFGRKLGIAFQIVDDLLGVIGDPKITGKPVGGDLREGKKTLPIFLAISKADSNERKLIERVHGNSSATDEEIEKAVSLIRRLGVEDEVRRIAKRYADQALRHLNLLPNGSGKVWLEKLVEFVVKRRH